MKTAAAFLAIGVLACGAPPTAGDISPEELLASPPPSVLILDVRSVDEFASGHVPDAVNIPHDELASRLGELRDEKDAAIVLYCERGTRAGMAAGVLADAGYTNLLHLEGDMSEWRAKGRPTAQP